MTKKPLPVKAAITRQIMPTMIAITRIWLASVGSIAVILSDRFSQKPFRSVNKYPQKILSSASFWNLERHLLMTEFLFLSGALILSQSLLKRMSSLSGSTDKDIIPLLSSRNLELKRLKMQMGEINLQNKSYRLISSHLRLYLSSRIIL